jgi:NADH dehydrogenase FAD-containing subunit
MGPGLLSRMYTPEQVRFDVKAMIESRGGLFVEGKVVGVNPHTHSLSLESGGEITYDLVSFNVGSHVHTERIPGAKDVVIPVKPIENFEIIRNEILSKLNGTVPRILIVGGGPAGIETAGNIWRLVHNSQGRADIAIVNSGDRLLPTFRKRASQLAEKSLKKRGVHILPQFRVKSVEQRCAVSQSGESVDFDIAVLATGVSPPTIFARSGLKTSEDGALLVNDYLQSIEHPEIFGGGDCVTLQGKGLPRIGVYAVRQAPLLFHNLFASLNGRALKPFHTKRHYGLILNMGDGRGMYMGRFIVWSGRLAFRLKDRIDRRFMEMFHCV